MYSYALSPRFWIFIALLLAAPATGWAQPPVGEGQDSGLAGGPRAKAVSLRVASALMARLGSARHRGLGRASQCLDALLTQVNSLRHRLDRHAHLLKTAQAKGDRAEARRQADMLRRLTDQTRQLERQSSTCETRRRTSQTRVTAIIPASPRGEPAPL